MLTIVTLTKLRGRASFRYNRFQIFLSENTLVVYNYQHVITANITVRYAISLIWDKRVTTQNLAFLSYWNRKKQYITYNVKAGLHVSTLLSHLQALVV